MVVGVDVGGIDFVFVDVIIVIDFVWSCVGFECDWIGCGFLFGCIIGVVGCYVSFDWVGVWW